MTTVATVSAPSVVNQLKTLGVPLARFTPSGREPATGMRTISFDGVVDGKAVQVSLSPPGTTFWKGNFSVWVDGVGQNYEASHALAGALRKAGWTQVADLVAKEPSAQQPFADLSEAKLTKSATGPNGTLLATGEFVLTGKLAPDSVGTVRYEPTADGRGRVFLAVQGGALAGPERELTGGERAQLAERLAHTFQAPQAAKIISSTGYDAWETNVPGRGSFPGPPANPWSGFWQYYADRAKAWSNWMNR